MSTALFIGRFQPFHNGHYNALETALHEYDRVVVGIGSAQASHTFRNPLSVDEREQMLRNCFPDVPIERFEDQESNEQWTDNVEERVEFDTIISGNSLVRELLGDCGYNVEDPDYLKPEQYSGTYIRNQIADGADWEHLVPDCSLEVLQKLGFVNRIQEIQQNTLE